MLGRFRRKSEEKERLRKTESLALTVVQDATAAHRAKLASEARLCPGCSFRVINPMTDRCPRCFGAVPPSDHTNCGECDHVGNCDLASVMNQKGSDDHR